MKLFVSLVFLTSFNLLAQDAKENPLPEDFREGHSYKHIAEESYWVYNEPNNLFTDDRRFGLLKNGKLILPIAFIRHKDRTYQNSKDTIILSQGEFYGMYSIKQEKWLFPLIYEEIYKLHKDFYKVELNGKQGLFDGGHNELIPIEWAYISSIGGLDSHFVLHKRHFERHLSGIYSLPKGDFDLPCEYDAALKIPNCNYFKVIKNGRYNIANLKNELQFKEWYFSLIRTSEGGNFIANNGQYYGIIDLHGKVVAPFIYKDFENFPYLAISTIARDKQGKYGMIKDDGEVTLPFVYDELHPALKGAISKQNGKYGIIGMNGNRPTVMVNCIYDEIEHTFETFVARSEAVYTFLNKSGKPRSEYKYSFVDIIEFGPKKSLFKAFREGGYYLISYSGQELNEIPFKSLDPLVDPSSRGQFRYYYNFKYLKVQMASGKYKLIDKQCQQVTEDVFDNIHGEFDHLVIVEQNGKQGIYSLNSKDYIISCEYDFIKKDKDHFLLSKNSSLYTFIPGQQATPLESR